MKSSCHAEFIKNESLNVKRTNDNDIPSWLYGVHCVYNIQNGYSAVVFLSSIQ